MKTTAHYFLFYRGIPCRNFFICNGLFLNTEEGITHLQRSNTSEGQVKIPKQEFLIFHFFHLQRYLPSNFRYLISSLSTPAPATRDISFEWGILWWRQALLRAYPTFFLPSGPLDGASLGNHFTVQSLSLYCSCEMISLFNKYLFWKRVKEENIW